MRDGRKQQDSANEIKVFFTFSFDLSSVLLNKLKEYVTSDGMTHEYDLGIVTSTFPVRLYVIVKKLLLGFDLLLESKRVSGGFGFLAILSRLKAPQGMATNVKSRRFGRRRAGEQTIQSRQERLVVLNQAWVSRQEINQIVLSLSIGRVCRRLVAYLVAFLEREISQKGISAHTHEERKRNYAGIIVSKEETNKRYAPREQT